MKFILPFPPSVNASYKMTKGKRHKGDKVVAWEEKATRAINQQNILPFVGRCFVIYELYTPDNYIRDAANYEKVTTDFLVQRNILQGDDRRYIKGILSYWNDTPGKQVTVNIIPCDEFVFP